MTTMLEIALTHDISKNTLINAKGELGVIAKKTIGGKSEWSFPEGDDEDSFHAPDVGTSLDDTGDIKEGGFQEP